MYFEKIREALAQQFEMDPESITMDTNLIDDLGAVLIIAVFYTGDLNLPALGGAAVVLAAGSGWARLVRAFNAVKDAQDERAKAGSQTAAGQERVRVQPGSCCYGWD